MKKVAVFVGSHSPFSKEEIEAIDQFCYTNDSLVLCDQTSNYRGQFRFLANLSNQQEKVLSSKHFDLIIHIGSVSGSYLQFDTKEVWRVNKDGEVRDSFGKMTAVFEMEEETFFRLYVGNKNSTDLFDKCVAERERIIASIPELPFSNLWIAKQVEGLLPKKSTVHFAILNSLRAWNIFETDNTITCFSNTGGFGIDGCLSSFIGAALTNKEKEFYGIFGDLSFFYDINALTNSIPNNTHLLVVNNGVGAEFKNYTHIASAFGNMSDLFIAAKGHNGNKSPTLLKRLVEESGFYYICASDKKGFISIKDEWLSKHDKPIICEVFINDADESDALYVINHIIRSSKNKFKSFLKKNKIIKIIRRVIRR